MESKLALAFLQLVESQGLAMAFVVMLVLLIAYMAKTARDYLEKTGSTWGVTLNDMQTRNEKERREMQTLHKDERKEWRDHSDKQADSILTALNQLENRLSK